MILLIIRDTVVRINDGKIIKERKQNVNGMTYIVQSVFDNSSKTTAEKQLDNLIKEYSDKQ